MKEEKKIKERYEQLKKELTENLIETIVGVQFWCTGLILLTLKELAGGLLCIFIGVFILLGLFKWVMNIVCGFSYKSKKFFTEAEVRGLHKKFAEKKGLECY
jgi:hypothetical protein